MCSLKKLFWKYSGNSQKIIYDRAYWKLITMLNVSSVANVLLEISWKYSEQIFRTTILKEKLSMDVLCFIKNTSGWVLLMRWHSKKALLEVNPPQGWPWKQNCTTVVAAVMILKVVSNWKSMLQINILKKS